MLSSFHRPTEQEQGFTLIELLVVIIIIGILAAIAIPLFLDQRKLAVDASVKADVRNTVANIQTWQANDETKRTKAEANTGAYVADGGKIAQTPGNSIGVSIDSSGAATVCAYNAGGKTYLTDSASYVFNPATGQFTTGACVASSTTGGTASTGASAGAAAPTGGISNGVYTATLEDGDTTNSMWSGVNRAGAISTAKANTGTKSYVQTYTGSNASSNSAQGTNGVGSAWINFTPSPSLVSGKNFYQTDAYVYVDPTKTGGSDRVALQASYTTNGSTSTTLTSTPVSGTGWQKISLKLPTNTFGPQTTFQFFAYSTDSSSTGGTLYVDDFVITPTN